MMIDIDAMIRKEIENGYGDANGITNYRHFTDDGISGTRFDRPGFLAMMEQANPVAVNAQKKAQEIA